MCGFAGVIGPERPDEATLRKMAAALRHRGPDDQGVWCDDQSGVGFAHARLAVVDLSPTGHQPMRSPAGRYIIAYNGEIYNHRELRARLDARTQNMREWRGHSDTETLLGWFDEVGVEETLKLSVGMFAFGVWDRETRTLTLARDRIGEKPLYYGWQGSTFLFGSELKALRAHPAFHGDIDRDALDSYRQFGYVPSPQSIYRGIHKLTAGTLVRVRAGDREATPQPYWSMYDAVRRGLNTPFAGSESDAIGVLEARLGDATSLQQLADVPIGAFLSGGIDSSLVVALMQARSTQPVHTFTIGFDDQAYDEAPYAKAVANHLGTAHTELYVTGDEARGVIARLPTVYDEPFADASQIPAFLVSQLARRSVTVSLSGDGGDEMFGGYNRYTWGRKLLGYPRPVRRLLASGFAVLRPSQWSRLHDAAMPLLPRSMRVRLSMDKAHKLASVMSGGPDSAVYERLVSTWDRAERVVIGGRSTLGAAEAWNLLGQVGSTEDRMMALDAVSYLPDDVLCKVDRAAMAVSLETRTPFLDHRVVEFAWTLPLPMKIRDGQGKWILRQLLRRYVPSNLTDRPKMGFGVPIDAWLRGPLRKWADDLLSDARLSTGGYFSPEPIVQKWNEHKLGVRNWHLHLWPILMFQAWLAEQTSLAACSPNTAHSPFEL